MYIFVTNFSKLQAEWFHTNYHCYDLNTENPIRLVIIPAEARSANRYLGIPFYLSSLSVLDDIFLSGRNRKILKPVY